MKDLHPVRVRLGVIALCALQLACTTAADDPAAPRPGASGTSAGTPGSSEARARRRLQESVTYRDFCIRRDAPPAPLVAAFDGRRVVVTPLRGGEVARVPGRPPVRWSASGHLLALGPRGSLWTRDGERYEGPDVPLELSDGTGALWAWSPSRDCALVLDDGRLSAFHTGAGANGVVLVPQDVESFAWGRGPRFAVLMNDEGQRSLWMANLRTAQMRNVVRFARDVCCVVLGGWAPSRNHILFWAGPGNSAMQDGWTLESVDGRGTRRAWGRTLPRPGTIAPCGSRVAALTGGDRHLQGNRVSLLGPRRGRRDLSRRGTFRSLTCSGAGSFVVASSDGGLDTFPAARGRRTSLTSHARLTDLLPEWGRRRAGILFVRQTGLVRQLWLVAKGLKPRYVANLEPPSAVPPDVGYDWTATPPTGLPAGV